MDRRTFLLISGGVMASARAGASSVSRRRETPDRTLLEAGLHAMARSDGWFNAHWGAALIAGSYLCVEAGLAEDASRAIRAELEVVRSRNADVCKPFPKAAVREGAVRSIKESLLPAIDGGLRAHGHAVIYTSLAIRALTDVPELAIPSIVDPILGWNRKIAGFRAQAAPEGAKPYRDGKHLVQDTFDSIVRFEPVVGHPRIHRPNFTHMITHTEALRWMKSAGYADVWADGWKGHRAHISPSVPAVRDATPEDRTAVTLEAVRGPDYWKDATHRRDWHKPWHRSRNPNGDWIASGHLFKVLYAFSSVARLVPDKRLVDRVARVVFERYFDPQVLGG